MTKKMLDQFKWNHVNKRMQNRFFTNERGMLLDWAQYHIELHSCPYGRSNTMRVVHMRTAILFQLQHWGSPQNVQRTLGHNNILTLTEIINKNHERHVSVLHRVDRDLGPVSGLLRASGKYWHGYCKYTTDTAIGRYLFVYWAWSMWIRNSITNIVTQSEKKNILYVSFRTFLHFSVIMKPITTTSEINGRHYEVFFKETQLW